MRLLSLLLVALYSAVSVAQTKLFDEPLKPLEITLTSNFELINTPSQTGAEIGRNDLGQGMIEPIHFRSPGTLSYRSEAGEVITLEVEVEPRGMRRRRSCEYKPLDIKFKNRPQDELFENTSKSVEIVSHCEGSNYMRDFYTEYFSYRTKAAILAPGFRVRKANFTYVDTGGRFATATYPAILLEPKKDMAKRNNAEVLRLTTEEEERPFTQAELDSVSWAKGYGDSYVPKIAMRARIYNRYLALNEIVKPNLREIFLQRLGLSLISNFDVTQQWLVNIFPIQFASGAVQMVEYDFDAAAVSTGFRAGELEQIFLQYAFALGLTIDAYKRLRTDAEKEADIAMILAAIQEAIASYQASGLEEELSNFGDKKYYEPLPLLNVLKDSMRELNGVLQNPDKAFKFIR